MHFDVVTALMFFFLTAGVISTGIIVYLFISDLFKKNKPVDNEPEYAEEEQFYASLLQQKSDADAFNARRAMVDEFLRHK